MNEKIVLSVLIAFVITFGLLFTINYLRDSPRENLTSDIFYSQQFDPKINKIFLIGSSHIGHLNTTLIIENIKQNHKNFDVYNLAENGDSPKVRSKSISKIISTNPELVFYGISFRDFHSEPNSINANQEFFNIQQTLENNIPNELVSINPQKITRTLIRDFLNDVGLVKLPVYDIYPPNTPFFYLGPLQTVIKNDDELQRQLLLVLPKPSEINIQTNNEQVKNFKQIILEFQKNDIKVVLFITPSHRIYLSEIPSDDVKAFDEIITQISNEFNLKIYDFNSKYSDLLVWNNLDHIAYNEDSMGFSQDISEMILMEIDS